MADAAPATAPAQASPAKAKKPRSSGPKKPKAPAAHPPIADMVKAAIKELKERNGSSSQAIRKYIASHYKVDVERLQPFIRRFLKSATASGTLIQTKGKGAAGSFKLAQKAAGKLLSLSSLQFLILISNLILIVQHPRRLK